MATILSSRPGLARWVPLAALAANRRGAIAIFAGIAMPVMLLGVALGVEISRWAAIQGEMQRVADLASLAGVQGLASNDTNAEAANAAANVAELNGATGSSSRSWDGTNLILSDNTVTVSVVAGLHNSADPAIKVVVTKSMPLLFSGLITSATTQSMRAVSVAELGPQPCVLSLGTNGANGISGSGTPSFNLKGCSAYSDNGITMKGTVTINASALYAAGGISIGSNVTGTATNPAVQSTGAPVITDPYAGDATVQNALAAAKCAPALSPAVSGTTVTLQPNTCYGTIKVAAGYTLDFASPGLYLINGSLTVSGNTGTAISGSGITIASTGPISITGNFNQADVSLTASTVYSATNGAIPGILFASDTNQASSFGGNASVPFTGLVYTPNASLSFAGTPVGGSTGCAKIIAKSVSMVGTSSLASTCSSFQLTSFGGTLNNQLIQLVQ
ncbi:MAG: hypothetical protein KGI51_06575 [Rhodospirillales bacterium]|nr:hypothetical protein [Rhodospirillales bacterium]